MSNVLIGIIGVILFIGLALAGALFLGPRFQQSKLQGQVAAVTMQVDQISKAYDMYKTMEGKTTTQVSVLVSSGYLKNPPQGMFPEDNGFIVSKPELSVQQHFGENYVQVLYNMPGAQADLCALIREKAGQTQDAVDFTTAVARRGTMFCNTFNGRNGAFIVLEKIG
jgi:hypothetical protein